MLPNIYRILSNVNLHSFDRSRQPFWKLWRQKSVFFWWLFMFRTMIILVSGQRWWTGNSSSWSCQSIDWWGGASLPASKLLLSAFTLISFSPTILRRLPSSVPLGLSPLPGAGGSQPEAAAALAANRARLRIFARGRYRGQQVSVGLKGVEGMEIPNPVSMFEARHGDNTDVLLALLTQNKELEGKAKLKTLKL